MGFLVVPLVLVIIAAVIARLKHMGKLRKLKLVGVGNSIETKQKELGKWMGRTINSKNRNGFTRLRQESDDEETEPMTGRPDNGQQNGSLNNNHIDESESSSEVEINLPNLTKA
jgi:hypothetical protein